MVRTRRLEQEEPFASDDLITSVRSHAFPLRDPHDLDPLVQRIGRDRFVLLGEASHVTHEYYAWRAAPSRRLIEEKGFTSIAVEGEWPDCYRINRFVRGFPEAGENAHDVL
jgi:erythromycin esterase-like protein